MFAADIMRSSVQFVLAITTVVLVIIGSGCANIIPPAGGPRDSIPPQLISATPPDSAKNVKPQRIVLTFNEYIAQLQNTQDIIISPTIEKTPTIDSRLRTVTVRFQDTLEANTTYSINFANTVRDVNEGNILQDFTYVFSTGNTIDQNSITGKVVLAETGKIDSTLIVVLHKNLSDTAITKLRPRYYTRIDGSGNFRFDNLPAENFSVFVVPGTSFSRQFDSTSLFAFLNAPVKASDTPTAVTLLAYIENKPKPKTNTNTPAPSKSLDKRLRYSNAEAGLKDIFTPLQLQFVRKLSRLDSSRIVLTDTNYNRLSSYSVRLDTGATKIIVQHQWRLNTTYKLIIPQDAVADAEGITLTKADTLTFSTHRAEDYGSVRLRFTNVDLSKNPVLQIVQNETIIQSAPLNGREWRQELFKPGDYELRILYDANKNGVWDPGNYKLKIQPEVVQPVQRKLSIKANWDNEVDIAL
jgi:hypothetical protein